MSALQALAESITQHASWLVIHMHLLCRPEVLHYVSEVESFEGLGCIPCQRGLRPFSVAVPLWSFLGKVQALLQRCISSENSRSLGAATDHYKNVVYRCSWSQSSSKYFCEGLCYLNSSLITAAMLLMLITWPSQSLTGAVWKLTTSKLPT